MYKQNTKNPKFIFSRIYMLVVILLFYSPVGIAQVAILDFEINDLTLPSDNSSIEQQRKNLRPLLSTSLESMGHKIIDIPLDTQQSANPSFGYLFDHPAEAAELGQKHHAQHMVIGRLHRPSYLFTYLIIKVIDVPSAKVVAEFVQEAKGAQDKSMRRSVVRLAEKFNRVIPAISAQSIIFDSYKQTSNKPFDDIIDDLLFGISEHNFRLTEHAQIGQAISEREQIDFPQASVLHFCSLTYAKAFILAVPNATSHMPCRIAVTEQENGSIEVEALLLSKNLAHKHEVIREVNSILKSIVDIGVE